MSVATVEPTLDAVKTEDRQLILDLLRVIQGLKCCSTYAVNPAPKGYEVVGWLPSDRDSEVTHEFLELIEQVNPLRIRPIGVRFNSELQKACLRVRVVSMTERCLMSETVLFSVRKRVRGWE